jgi:uncharacterized membrane protein YraQ (UPF0718 family)
MPAVCCFQSATSSFVVRDMGNCSPRMMRCTLNTIPCSGDLLSTSGMPLALMVQPLALDLAEELIQVKYFNLYSPMFMIGHPTTVHSAVVGSYTGVDRSSNGKFEL